MLEPLRETRIRATMAAMKMFVIKLESGEYVTQCRMSTHYLVYERTIHPAAADRFN
jgi:hypothetical protein